MRATDRDRDRTVSRLRGAYLQGSLSTDTFEMRAALVYRSQTADELAGVTYDLPSVWARARLLASQISAWLQESFPARTIAVATAIELPQAAGERLLVGRHQQCDVVIDDPSVSRWHLAIAYDGSAWEARDLRSTNGTFIDNRRITAAQARPGDLLYVGRSAVRLVRSVSPDRR